MLTDDEFEALVNEIHHFEETLLNDMIEAFQHDHPVHHKALIDQARSVQQADTIAHYQNHFTENESLCMLAGEWTMISISIAGMGMGIIEGKDAYALLVTMGMQVVNHAKVHYPKYVYGYEALADLVDAIDTGDEEHGD